MLSINNIFRITIVVGAITYVAYWLLPYSYGYLDSETGILLSYGGYGAIYSGNEILDVAILVMSVVSSLGMFFYWKVARYIFLLLIATVVAVPLYGLSIQTAGGAMLLDVVHITDGMALALAYFSPVKDRFK